jgi:hypothetical protein
VKTKKFVLSGLILMLAIALLGAKTAKADSTIPAVNVSGTWTNISIVTSGMSGTESISWYDMNDAVHSYNPTWTARNVAGSFMAIFNPEREWGQYISAKMIISGAYILTVDSGSDYQAISWAPEYWTPKPKPMTTTVTGTRINITVNITGAQGNEGITWYDANNSVHIYQPAWIAGTSMGNFAVTFNPETALGLYKSAKVNFVGTQILSVDPNSDFQSISWAPEYWSPKPKPITTTITGTWNNIKVSITGAMGNESITWYDTSGGAHSYNPSWNAGKTLGDFSVTFNPESVWGLYKSAKVNHGGPQTLSIDPNSSFVLISWAPDFWGPKPHVLFLPGIFK